MFLSKDSVQRYTVTEKSGFYSQKIEGLDPKVVDKLVEAENKFWDTQNYLRKLAGLIATNRSDIDLNTVEVPECLQDAAPKEEPPKKKATAPRSKKKSPTKQKKTASSSNTKAST